MRRTRRSHTIAATSIAAKGTRCGAGSFKFFRRMSRQTHSRGRAPPLRHRGSDVVEGVLHLVAEHEDDDDDQAGDGGDDQTVLDGRRALFVFPELLQVSQLGTLLLRSMGWLRSQKIGP